MGKSLFKRWTHPDVILVATDLSDLDRLMPFALDQASQTTSRLILLHVIATSACMAVDAMGMPYYDPAGTLEFVEKLLRPWSETARRHGIVCDVLVREGQPSQQIIAAARQFPVDRILLGTRSRSKLGKVLLGSVAEQVLRSVHLPVITVGPEAHLPVQSGFEQRVVLHATTLRETSRPGAALAWQLADSLDARLVLLHVMPPLDEMRRNGEPAELDSIVMEKLRTLGAEISAENSQLIDAAVVHGNPSIEILAEACERKASLIVLGAARRSIFENLARDGTVYRVLAHARCPVLTLREEEIASADIKHEHEAVYRS
jgi:nucleotide-binding universal stress UspA family protein